MGTVELDVTGPAGSCPGVYAAVRRPGTVSVGDPALAGEAADRVDDSADTADVSGGTAEPA